MYTLGESTSLENSSPTEFFRIVWLIAASDRLKEAIQTLGARGFFLVGDDRIERQASREAARFVVIR